MLSVCFSPAFIRIVTIQRLSRTATLLACFGTLLRNAFNAVLFALQSWAENPAFCALEKLCHDRLDDALILGTRDPQAAHNPVGIVGNGTFGRPPAEAQKAGICAIFFNAQVRGVGFIVGHVKRQIWDTHAGTIGAKAR